MTCPACGSPLEELLIQISGVFDPCGIFRCDRCRYPDNRWLLVAGRLVRRALEVAAVAMVVTDVARILR